MLKEHAIKIAIWDIIQVSPDKETFGGCLVIVTEKRDWGVQGYVQSAGVNGQQWIRLNWDDIEPTDGKAVWIVGDPNDTA